MRLSKIDGLTDGIFVVVMTLMIIEIRVPEFHNEISNKELWKALIKLGPLCLSYVLSFTLLFTYWRAHSFVVAIAKNLDLKLTNQNALFLFFIGLIPFTTHLLGKYSYTQLAVCLYGLNIMLIGLSLIRMRNYIIKSDRIDNLEITSKSNRHANIRLLVPVICALIAIGIGFINTFASMSLFTLLILFNLTPAGADTVDYLIRKVEKKELNKSNPRTQKSDLLDN